MIWWCLYLLTGYKCFGHLAFKTYLEPCQARLHLPFLWWTTIPSRGGGRPCIIIQCAIAEIIMEKEIFHCTPNGSMCSCGFRTVCYASSYSVFDFTDCSHVGCQAFLTVSYKSLVIYLLVGIIFSLEGCGTVLRDLILMVSVNSCYHIIHWQADR